MIMNIDNASFCFDMIQAKNIVCFFFHCFCFDYNVMSCKLIYFIFDLKK